MDEEGYNEVVHLVGRPRAWSTPWGLPFLKGKGEKNEEHDY